LTKRAQQSIDWGTVPHSIVIEIEKPFSGLGAENSDFLPRAVPIPDNRQIPGLAKIFYTLVDGAAIQNAVTIDVEFPQAEFRAYCAVYYCSDRRLKKADENLIDVARLLGDRKTSRRTE
jgi:hypothetical protein